MPLQQNLPEPARTRTPRLVLALGARRSPPEPAEFWCGAREFLPTSLTQFVCFRTLESPETPRNPPEPAAEPAKKCSGASAIYDFGLKEKTRNPPEPAPEPAVFGRCHTPFGRFMVSHRDFIILLLKSGVKPYFVAWGLAGAWPGACRADPWTSRILTGGVGVVALVRRPALHCPHNPAPCRPLSLPSPPEPTGTRRNPPEPTGMHRHPPEPAGMHRHPLEPAGTRWNPPAPAGTRWNPPAPAGTRVHVPPVCLPAHPITRLPAPPTRPPTRPACPSARPITSALHHPSACLPTRLPARCIPAFARRNPPESTRTHRNPLEPPLQPSPMLPLVRPKTSHNSRIYNQPPEFVQHIPRTPTRFQNQALAPKHKAFQKHHICRILLRSMRAPW